MDEETVYVDFLCYKSGEYYNYTESYKKSLFSEDNTKSTDIVKISYFKDNIPAEYTFAITNLKGVISFDSTNDNNIKIFEKDVYKREISSFVDNYYVSANYDSKQEFSEIFVFDLSIGKQQIIKTPDYISFDSYVQGIVDNSLYI